MNKLTIFLIVAGLIVAGWFYFRPHDSLVENDPINNPIEESPVVDNEDNWETVTHEDLGITFRYPENLGTTYLSTVDWPPQVNLVNGAYECTEAGEVIDQAGETRERVVDDRTYCVTRISEGAAGSVYTQYAYLTEFGEDVYAFTFSLRSPQCGNFDTEEALLCEEELASFDVNALVHEIVETFKG